MRRIVFFLMAVLLFSACSKEEKSTVVDWEGNEYKTKNYGGTWWMVENLRTTRANNGQNIWVSSDDDAHSYTTPYCYFVNDDEKDLKKRGCLYNWSAAQQVCPEGWHLPTTADYEALTTYMRSVKKYGYKGNSNAIAKAMAAKTVWAKCDSAGTPGNGYKGAGGAIGPFVVVVDDVNIPSNNASGFNAMPVGYYTPLINNCFGKYSIEANFWLADEVDNNNARIFGLVYNEPDVVECDADKSFGCSVRCVKNE